MFVQILSIFHWNKENTNGCHFIWTQINMAVEESTEYKRKLIQVEFYWEITSLRWNWLKKIDENPSFRFQLNAVHFDGLNNVPEHAGKQCRCQNCEKSVWIFCKKFT